MEEVLKPLSYWGALFGLVPSRNVFNSIREQQNCRRPLFWWCVLVFILQVVQGILVLHFNYFAYCMKAFSPFPTALVVFFLAITGLSIMFNFIPRLPFIHHTKLGLASKKIKQFDNMFKKFGDDLRSEKLRRRLKKTLGFGTLWVILAIFGIIFPTLHASKKELLSAHHLFEFLFIQLIQIICFVHAVIAFLIFYMANTIIAIRLRVLIKGFQNLVPIYGQRITNSSSKFARKLCQRKAFPNSRKKGNKVPRDTRKFEGYDTIRKGFHTLYEASVYFNGACSLAILLFLCFNLFMCSISLFILIYTLIAWSASDAIQITVLSLVVFLSDLSFFLIILSSANKPVTQWRNLLRVVSQCKTVNMSIKGRTEILIFAQQVRNSSFSLSPAGMFHVGTHLVPGISASILTYIIVMLQSTTEHFDLPPTFNYTSTHNCSE